MTETIILFVDNDTEFSKTRGEFLEKQDYTVVFAADPFEAKRLIEEGHVNLAVVDLRLINDDDEKDFSGINLAKQTSPYIPKIILTRFPTYEAVREALGPSIDGLSPAVAFVAKQEGPQALLTAVRKVLELGSRLQARVNRLSAAAKKDNLQTQQTNSLYIDLANKEVWVEGRQVELAPGDYIFLLALYERSNQLCSREIICQNAYGVPYDRAMETTINSAVSRLRQKIEPNPLEPKYIITKRGLGYKLILNYQSALD